MKVFALQGFDRAPEVTEVDLPTPGPAEVRVRVRAASLNGFDLSVANSYLRGIMEHRFPVVLGKDYAGEVDAVGPNVEGYQVGDRVFGVVMKDTLGDGSLGEYVTVPVAFGIAKLPDGIDFTEAAALGLAGAAAVDAFDAANVTADDTVLVVGATGGVGQQVLQLAVRAGATVMATAHSEEEIELVRQLGAARTVDYRGDVVEQVRAKSPEGVDVVLHFAGDPAPLVAVVKPGGTRGCQVVCVNTSEEVSTDDGCHDESARTAGVGAPGRVCAGRGGQAGPGRFAGRVDGPGRRGFVAVDWGGRVSAGAGETGAGSRPGCGAE